MATTVQKPVDPLNIIFYMIMAPIGKNKTMLILICVSGLTALHLFNVVSIVEIVYYKNTEDVVTRIIFLVVTLPSSAFLITVLIFCEEISKIKEVVETVFINIETRGVAFQTRMRKDAKFCTILASVHLIESILLVLSFSICDNKSSTLVFNTIAKLSLIYRWCANLTIAWALFHITMIPNIPVFYVMYISCHIKFQYHILMDYLRENIRSFIDLHDETEQRDCQRHLQKCVDHILKIKRGNKMFTHMLNRSYLAFYISAVLPFVVSAYSFFVQDMSVKTNSFTFLVCFKIVGLFFHGCIDGQRIINESTNFYHFICRAPWIYWDRTNRMTFLMILINARNPLKISSFGFNLDYTLMIKAVKMTYTLMTLVPKLLK